MQKVRPIRPERSGREALGRHGGAWDVVDRGRGTLALNDDKKTKSSRRAQGAGSGDKAADGNVGHALRSVYSRTVSEDIPPELLDLLGKLK